MVILPILFVACTTWGPPAPLLASAPADTLVEAGGHRLHVEVIRGERPVAFVLESGGGADLSSWASVPESIAARTGATVVTYDRAGFGGSELGPADLLPADQIEDLRGILETLEIPRPRVLVGHSYGGLMVLLHASRHPGEIAGILLVDPMNPRFVEATGDFVHSTVPEIPDPDTDRERALARLTVTFDAFVGVVGAEESAIHSPMAIVTAGEPWWGPAEIDAAWRASHEAMAAAAANRWLVVAEGSEHDIPEARPDAIVDAAVRLLDGTTGPG